MNNRRLNVILASTMLVVAATGVADAQTIAAPAGQRSLVPFGKPLICANSRSRAKSAMATALRAVGAKPTSEDLAWAFAVMRSAGFPSVPLIDDEAFEAAKITSWLARRGNIVAAKMHNDQASEISGYKGFSRSMESFLTVISQPLMHGNDDGMAIEVGNKSPRQGRAEAQDIDVASRGLTEIIHRAHTARLAVGDLYEKPVVRFYLLAQGFQDDVAVLASGSAICALKLGASELSKLNVSARYMAMPHLSVRQAPVSAGNPPSK